MNDSQPTEVEVYCPTNYKFLAQFNFPWRRFIEAVVVTSTFLYFLWTINFVMNIKILGTIIIGVPLALLLLIGYKGKSIGQIIILSIVFHNNKIKLHLRSVNDAKTKHKQIGETDIFGKYIEKAKGFFQKSE